MRLGYVIIHVPDVPAALAFYQRAFGLELRFLAPGEQYGELQTGGTALAFAAEALIAQYNLGVRVNRPDQAPAAVEIGLVTDDVAAAYAKAVAEGAAPAMAPVEKPWGQTVAYVRDLNGFLVEICSPIGG
jgi:lactoylglutathione lyase